MFSDGESTARNIDNIGCRRTACRCAGSKSHCLGHTIVYILGHLGRRRSDIEVGGEMGSRNAKNPSLVHPLTSLTISSIVEDIADGEEVNMSNGGT